MKKKTKKEGNKTQFYIGLILALFSGVLMFMGIGALSARIVIGIIGIALIATSKYRLLD